MPIYEFEGLVPVVDPSAYVHPTAVLIGDVIIGPRCFVGPGAVLRGDLSRLVMEAGSNLQDCCVMHSFHGREVRLAADAHIGHGAVLHGCTVGRNALVGINAVVMDEALIGEEAIVGALAFVKVGMVVEPRTLVAGIPARVLRAVTDEDVVKKSWGTAHYHHFARRYADSAAEVEPLTAIEPGRPSLPDPDGEPG